MIDLHHQTGSDSPQSSNFSGFCWLEKIY